MLNNNALHDDTYTPERLRGEAGNNGYQHDGYSSVLLHQDAASSSARYNLVYRPPCLNRRLSPGEARPRFWVNPTSVPSKEAAVVSVAWCKSPQSAYRQYFTRGKAYHDIMIFDVKPSLAMKELMANQELCDKSKRTTRHGSSFMNACIRGGHADPMNGESEITGGKVTMDSGDNNLNIKTYPDFVLPFINKAVRLRLVCLDSKLTQMVGAYGHLNQGQYTDPCAELSHLIRNMHWLRLYLTYSHDVSGLPQVCLEEHHGGTKRFKKIRYRTMPISWIDMDHRKPAIRISGDSFVLNLEPPPPNLRLEDFPEGNEGHPAAVGIYVRSLDTATDTKIQFSACLFCRYNQSTGGDHQSEEINFRLCPDTFLDGDSLH